MKNCALKSDVKTQEWYKKEMQRMDREIVELKLAQPAVRALINASIFSVNSLRKKSIDELGTLHGLGPASLKKLIKLLN